MLVAFLILTVLLLVVVVYLLGFRLGVGTGAGEVLEVRLAAAQAEREMHNLTRTAFVAMAEEAMKGGENR